MLQLIKNRGRRQHFLLVGNLFFKKKIDKLILMKFLVVQFKEHFKKEVLKKLSELRKELIFTEFKYTAFHYYNFKQASLIFILDFLKIFLYLSYIIKAILKFSFYKDLNIIKNKSLIGLQLNSTRTINTALVSKSISPLLSNQLHLFIIKKGFSEKILKYVKYNKHVIFNFHKRIESDVVLYKNFNYFHYNFSAKFYDQSLFLGKYSKKINYFSDIQRIQQKYYDCKFHLVLSKNWTFYHEIFSDIILCRLKSLIEKKFIKLMVKFSNFLKKSYLQINGILYIKLEILGKGGSGKVYKILRQDKKIFALKKNKIGEFGFYTLNNFVNEIAILKLLLGKSTIIQIIDAEINFKKKLMNIILEFGDYDLEYLLKKNNSSLNFHIIKDYWKQILKSVKELHEERIVHGDLKPSNFLFIKKSLKLIDFGISKPIDNNTTNITRDVHIGTLNYMSPEAILEIPGILEKIPKFKTSRASDIWSLGCILFQLSQGFPPFKDFSMIQKIHSIVNNTLKIKYLPDSKFSLIDIIENCLRRHPDSRPTIPELLEHSSVNLDFKL